MPVTTLSFRVTASMAAAILVSGCATVTRGTTDTVEIASVPSEAQVVFHDIAKSVPPVSCVTPCEIELLRNKTYRTTVSKDGYEPFTYRLAPKITTGGAAASLPNLNVVGIAIDMDTDADKNLRPDPVTVTLAITGGISFAKDGKDRRIATSDYSSKATDFILPKD